MAGISYNPDRAEVDEGSVVTAVIAVGTTAVEIKTSPTRNSTRQSVNIYNDSNATVYLGPATVTTSGANKGLPLLKGQFISLPLGDVGYFAIAASAGKNVIVTEFS